MRILLKFGPEASSACRSRMAFAFRLFCAVYGHRPLLNREEEELADACVCYGPPDRLDRRKATLFLQHLAGVRPPWVPAPPPTEFTREGEHTVLCHAPAPGREPDWLGEIFEWVSCADEYSVGERDAVGRIPFSATYLGRNCLSAQIPYAAVAMRFLQQALCRKLNRKVEPPASLLHGAAHYVVSTHDIDYWPAGRLEDAYRLAKNALISLAISKRPLLSTRQLWLALQVIFGGNDPLHGIYHLGRDELRHGIESTYFFLTCHRHRRDANYTINRTDVFRQIHLLTEAGMEVGAHGSYTSVDLPDRLAGECESLRKAGVYVWGSRQHWLRFTLDRLIPAVERCGVRYDSSLGWADRIGFRGGACFAFPPYNFKEERPATFLEIPLVIMDQSLHENFSNAKDGVIQAEALLATSRQYGWGGVSVLWHPAAFGGGWLSAETGEAFWRLLDEGKKAGDCWLSARAFLEAIRQRYIDVGLLATSNGPVNSGMPLLLSLPKPFTPFDSRQHKTRARKARFARPGH